MLKKRPIRVQFNVLYMGKLKMRSGDGVNRIVTWFPNGGRLRTTWQPTAYRDFHKLKEELGEMVEGHEER